MSTLSITRLSDQEILNMELEDLANMFLYDFSEILNSESAGSYQLDNFIHIVIGKRDFGVRCALSEAFQWLYNNGYIMRVLLNPESRRYFITRAGEKKLSEIEQQ